MSIVISGQQDWAKVFTSAFDNNSQSITRDTTMKKTSLFMVIMTLFVSQFLAFGEIYIDGKTIYDWAIENINAQTGSWSSASAWVNSNSNGAVIVNYNLGLLSLRQQSSLSLPSYSLINGRSDCFFDESGVDLGSSSNFSYNSILHCYINSPEIGYYPVLETHYNESTWNGTSGEVVDVSTYMNNGTAMGGAVPSLTAKLGSHSGSFNNTSAYVDYGSPDSLCNLTKITIALWVKIDDTGTDGLHTIIAKSHNTWDGDPYVCWTIMYYGWGSSMYCNMTFEDASVQIMDMSIPDTFAVWHLLVMTYDGSFWLSYIDGVERGRYAHTGTLATNSLPVVVGCRKPTDPDLFFSGLIDEVLILPYALSSNLVYLSLWNGGLGKEVNPIDGAAFTNSYLASCVYPTISQPSKVNLVVLATDLKTNIVLNTDLTAWVTRNAGTNWNNVSLNSNGSFNTSVDIYTGSTTNMVGDGSSIGVKIMIHTNKTIRLSGWAPIWQ